MSTMQPSDYSLYSHTSITLIVQHLFPQKAKYFHISILKKNIAEQMLRFVYQNLELRMEIYAHSIIVF